jgi:choline dehydrogenase-like flavoprotein
MLGVFGITPDGQMARMWPAGDDSSDGWEIIGGPLSGGVAVQPNSDGRLEAFARGPNGRLVHCWQAGEDVAWTAWSELGPTIRHGPVVSCNDDGRLEVFAVGADGRVGHLWQVSSGGHDGWSEWDEFDGLVRAAPSVINRPDGRLELFAVGSDGRLTHRWQLGPGRPGWSAWDAFDAEVDGAPAVSENLEGRFEVFAVGADGQLGHAWELDNEQEPGWSDWSPFGELVIGDPVVARNACGRVEVFAAGSDGCLGHTWQLAHPLPPGWSAWESFGWSLAGPPSVVENADGRLEVFGVGPEGRLGHAWQLIPDGLTGWSEWQLFGPTLLPGSIVAISMAPPDRRADQRLVTASAAATVVRPASDTRPVSADVCIVGAGPAGITLAGSLVGAGVSVVIVESGGWGEDFEAQELNHGDANGPIVKNHLGYLRRGRGRNIQGSAAGWGRGWCMPLRDLDYAIRPWVPMSGWPLSAEGMEPYMARAADTFGFDRFPRPEDQGGLVRLTYQFPRDPLLFRTEFRRLLGRPGFRAELGTTAVELQGSDGQISALRCVRMAGGEVKVSADVFVLAAGGVENARVLMLHASRFGLHSPMLGRCFMDHPHVNAGVVVIPDTARLRPFLGGPGRLDVLGLSEETMSAEGLLDASVQLRPITLTGGQAFCDLYVRTEQVPNSESRLELTERTDIFGCRRVRLEWAVTAQDWDSVVRTTELVAERLVEDYLARWDPALDPDVPWPGAASGPQDSVDATWGNHHTGTTRMGLDRDSSVVDPDGLVLGMSNLFVTGSSVFPTNGCANPTFTIVAMAHRLADHLSDTLQSQASQKLVV